MNKKEPSDHSGRTDRTADSASLSTRSALLDAAELVMLEEGYAAVSSRRLAARAGVNSALVHYYFGTMDNLFVALFRRGSERSYQRLLAAAESPQPLWALWAAIHDQSRTSLTMEFVSLATHRPSIRTEITQSSKRFRELQLEIVTRALSNHGNTSWTPITLVMLMSSVSRFLRIEESFDIDSGHAEITTLIEDFLSEVEGPERTD
jgi:AcrR family transcriptional regulator